MTWLFYAIIAAVLIGAAAILAKSGIKKADPGMGAVLTTLVMLVGAFILAGSKINNLNIFKYDASTAGFVLLSGALTGAAVICAFKALNSLEVTGVVPLVELNILMTLWITVIAKSGKFGSGLIISTILCIVGILVLGVTESKHWKKCGFAFLSAILFSVSSVVDLLHAKAVPAGVLRLDKLFIAFIAVLVITLSTGSGKKFRQLSFLEGVYSCLAGAAVALSWFFTNRANAAGSSEAVLKVLRADLIFAVILAAIFLKEKVKGRKILGAVIFVAGLEVLLFLK